MSDIAADEPYAEPHARPRTKPTRKCEHCGRRFAFERSTARFCSDTHRVEAYRKPRPKAVAFRGHLRSSVSDEWYTPAGIVEAARHALGGIDLDPASSAAAQETVRAARFFTKEEDGLTRPWSGRVFLAPPYGRLGPLFARKFVGHFPGDVPRAILVLANHHLSASWFACLAALEPATCMMSYRLRFGGSALNPTHGSVVLGFGVDVALFREVFSAHGWIR